MFAAGACAGAHEDAVRRDVSVQRAHFTTAAGQLPPASELDVSRGLPGYLAHALKHSPELRASFEQWQSSVHAISRARRLPEPTVGFGVFVRSVETRVGPQQARVSLQQSFPWPTKLSAGADAGSARARAQQRRFDAQALAVTRRVTEAYWALWAIRQTRAIHAEHLQILRSLSESVSGRLMTGAATLADQQQVDLAAARLEDMLRGMDEAERAAEAQLRAAVGASPDVAVPTPGEPPPAWLPAESLQGMRASAREHPLIASYAHLAQAGEQKARAEQADGMPSFTVGADWIITGEAPMPGVQDSGKDAVVVGASMSVPLWQGSYDDGAQAARAESMAQRAEQRAAIHRALAELESSLSAVRDSARRVGLYRDTLVPQADAAYASVLGAYATGQGSVAQTLLAQRDLLELRVDLDRGRGQYGQSWARLEQVVGRQVASQSVEVAQPARPAQSVEPTPAITDVHADMPVTGGQDVQ